MASYSRGGSREFNERLDHMLQELGGEIAATVGQEALAVVLGGGYGRGEGACVEVDGQERLYNDLDFFLVLKDPAKARIPQLVVGRRQTILGSLEPLCERWEERLHIDVDIGRPLYESELSALPHELMWFDLFHGYTVIWGPADVLERNAPPWVAFPPPPLEAARLMLNRGSGLLQAIHYAATGAQPPDADFVRRNYFKCLLAFGDAWLLSAGTYKTALSKRLERFQALQSGRVEAGGLRGGEALYALVQDHYRRAIEFKEKPDVFSQEQMAPEQLIETAALWVDLFLKMEARRCRRTWDSPQHYRYDPFIREPLQHMGPKVLRNLLQNVRRGELSWRYPREQLYGRLVDLFAQVDPHSASWQERKDRFLSLWERFN